MEFKEKDKVQENVKWKDRNIWKKLGWIWKEFLVSTGKWTRVPSFI